MLISIPSKYITRQILNPFIGGVLFFSFVLIMFQMFKLSDLVILHGAQKQIILQLLIYSTISFVPITFPIAYLLSVMSAFGRMSSDSEIIALRAIGLGIVDLLISPILFGVIISCFCLYSNYYLVPWGNLAFKNTILKLENTKAVSNINEGTFTPGFFDLLVFTEKVNSEDNSMKHVFIFDERDKKNPTAIVAKTGRVIPLHKSEALATSILFRLNNGSIHKTKDMTPNYHLVLFNTYDMFLNTAESRAADVNKPITYDYDTLMFEMGKPKIEKDRERELLTEYWKRLALSISPVFLGLLGVGLGTIRTRAVKSQSAVFSLLILLGYWVLYIVGTKISEKGIMREYLAMNLGNIVLFVTSIISLYKTGR